MRNVLLQAALEFETELDSDDYRINDIDTKLTAAIQSVLGDYYSRGRINKPNIVLPFKEEK